MIPIFHTLSVDEITRGAFKEEVGIVPRVVCVPVHPTRQIHRTIPSGRSLVSLNINFVGRKFAIVLSICVKIVS